MMVGRGKEEHYCGLLGLWETFGGGDIVKIPWDGSYSFG